MGIKSTNISLYEYLNNFFKVKFDKELSVEKIEGNKVILSNRNGHPKVGFMEVRAVKSYSLSDLTRMQHDFFKKIFNYMENHNHSISSCISQGLSESNLAVTQNVKRRITDPDGDRNSTTLKESTQSMYYTEVEGYKDIYNYINSVIELSVGKELVVDDFPLNKYKYMVHHIDRDYLLELVVNFVGE